MTTTTVDAPRPVTPRPLLDRRLAIAPQIHQILRDRIVSLDWAPRRQIVRGEIADEFGVSQTPVREALLKLEADGLILVWPQSRTEVAPIDVTRVREVMFLRRALEIEVALTVAMRQPKVDLAAAQAIVDDQRRLADDDAAMARFMALDRAFHQTLFDLAGQAALHALLVERSADLDRVRRLHLPLRGKRLAILADHQAIVDAIAADEPLAVMAAVRQHLSGTAGTLDELVARHPSFF
ncbi:MAG: GntR family transcriptional regulator [Burkholderiaceae bacterium]|nr:GntR family transcriptional regulator [Burkholderiaceae bacterium]